MTALVSDKTFDQEVLKSSEPVLVDFFAEWCGPCKAMAPALEQVASEQKGKVKIVKIDVDQNPAITAKYGIRAMPTLILFKGGEVAGQHVGALVQKRKLEEWIGQQIGEVIAKA
jgi:thioredoxin 1